MNNKPKITWISDADKCPAPDTAKYEDPMDRVLNQMLGRFSDLIEVPQGFFLESSMLSTIYTPDTCVPISTWIIDRMKQSGFIEPLGEQLTAQEFEVQRALGTAQWMCKYHLTELGNAKAMEIALRGVKDPDNKAYWTSTSFSGSKGFVGYNGGWTI